MKRLLFIFFCVLINGVSAKSMRPAFGFVVTDTAYPPLINKKRLWIVGGSQAAFWTGSFIYLNKAWYADYPRSGFHVFNDNREWMQIDKAGHTWTAYQLSRLSTELWGWAGLSRNGSAVAGSASAIAFQSIIELQDGFSEQWGFSWGDLASNLSGAGAYLFQELGWKEQRLQIKMSYSPPRYPADLRQRRDQLFGRSAAERILKDYNAQTYWISANIARFLPGTGSPKWLSISIGYGAKGMLGARNNVWKDGADNSFDRRDILRTSRFYLSPDIDLSVIRVKSKLLRSILFALNSIKIPAPAIELDSRGRLGFHALRF